LLWLGDMNLFESLVHTFGTAGTGGFGIRGDSIAGYSAYSQWVITIFMILFGVNFNLYYMILLRHFKAAFKSEELWFYLGIIFTSSALIFVNIFKTFAGIEAPVRHAVFQVASIITTTGYATTDFTAWSGFAKGLLLLLMFVGGCAGSTAGGFKLSRVMLLGKSIRQNIRQLLHPHSVGVVRMEGKRVDEDTLNGVNAYLAIYCVLLGGIFLLLCLEPFSLETNLSAAVSCFNNVGPAFGDAAANYSCYSPWATLLLSGAMLLGRLEIFPLLILFLPLAWRRK
ncbi:MAG: TrkH family potassium uptake protein, partial [Clostridia bacterium]|nr:TrkH family potassium uptake protein [Clostridia bacterium]